MAYTDDWSVYCSNDLESGHWPEKAFAQANGAPKNPTALKKFLALASPRRVAVLADYGLIDTFVENKLGLIQPESGQDHEASYIAYGALQLGHSFWNDPMFAPFFRKNVLEEIPA